MSYTTESERRQVERGEDWDGWVKRMPKITVPAGCTIKVIPPAAGAIVRFVIYKDAQSVSVYFDAYGRLGYCDSPYWEAYPIGDNNQRYGMDQFDDMMRDIERELSGGPSA